MSLNQAIGDHTTGEYTVTRVAAREYDAHGRLEVAGAPTTFTILASVQPAEPEQMKDVPEGQSTADAKLILTETELKERSETTEPDTISIDGEDFRVYSVEKWQHWGETHYEAIALKLDET